MDNDDSAGPRRGGRCPICEAPTEQHFRPFCSKRCQELDLGRWLRDSYRIPTEEGPGEGDPGAADDDDNPFGPFGGRA
jgi:endogenous inhibitor of DNA gyrase (YacG/DUF329 family)